jgi:hypothetical protein
MPSAFQHLECQRSNCIYYLHKEFILISNFSTEGLFLYITQTKNSIGVHHRSEEVMKLVCPTQSTVLEIFCPEILMLPDSSDEEHHLAERKHSVKERPYVGLQITKGYPGNLNCCWKKKGSNHYVVRKGTPYIQLGATMFILGNHVDFQNSKFCNCICLPHQTHDRFNYH